MKQSELLRKQADMIDMAEKYGVDDWRKLVIWEDAYGEWRITSGAPLGCAINYKFAIGVVEGKPVFEGDEFYYNGCSPSVKQKAGSGCESWCKDTWGKCSWTPPKPNTVMVEMPYELAEYCSKLNVSMSPSVVNDVAQACRKAIEEQ